MWAPLVSAGVGVWVMLAPSLLAFGGAAATAHHLVGPLAVSFGLIASWQVTHGMRWLNLFLGLAFIAASMLASPSQAAVLNGTCCGAALSVLSFVRTPPKHRLGGGWPMLFRRD